MPVASADDEDVASPFSADLAAVSQQTLPLWQSLQNVAASRLQLRGLTSEHGGVSSTTIWRPALNQPEGLKDTAYRYGMDSIALTFDPEIKEA